MLHVLLFVNDLDRYFKDFWCSQDNDFGLYMLPAHTRNTSCNYVSLSCFLPWECGQTDKVCSDISPWPRPWYLVSLVLVSRPEFLVLGHMSLRACQRIIAVVGHTYHLCCMMFIKLEVISLIVQASLLQCWRGPNWTMSAGFLMELHYDLLMWSCHTPVSIRVRQSMKLV